MVSRGVVSATVDAFTGFPVFAIICFAHSSTPYTGPLPFAVYVRVSYDLTICALRDSSVYECADMTGAVVDGDCLTME